MILAATVFHGLLTITTIASSSVRQFGVQHLLIDHRLEVQNTRDEFGSKPEQRKWWRSIKTFVFFYCNIIHLIIQMVKLN